MVCKGGQYVGDETHRTELRVRGGEREEEDASNRVHGGIEKKAPKGYWNDPKRQTINRHHPRKLKGGRKLGN